MRFLLGIILIFAWALAPAQSVVALNQITDFHLTTHGKSTRLIFDGNAPFDYHAFGLTNPERVVIDITNGYWLRNIEPNELVKSPISDIRAGHFQPHVLRIVLDLKYPVALTSAILPPDKNHIYHLELKLVALKSLNLPSHLSESSSPRVRPKFVTRFSRADLMTQPVRSLAEPVITAANTSPTVPSAPVLVNNTSDTNGNRPLIIEIDPGHGGKDSGARGPNGAFEKNVVLQISRYLCNDINHTEGFEAKMTRNADYYLTLRQRLAIARRDHADMFVAIHADAYRNADAHGASVYALSERGATSEAARWLANRENESELMGGVDLNNQDDLLKSVLINLSQTATIQTSLQIGQQIIQALGNITGLHYRHVEQAAFVVLKSPDIPSLLVETGFISNPVEESQLQNPHYQEHLAESIDLGISQFFLQNPPRGSWAASHRPHENALSQG